MKVKTPSPVLTPGLTLVLTHEPDVRKLKKLNFFTLWAREGSNQGRIRYFCVIAFIGNGGDKNA